MIQPGIDQLSGLQATHHDLWVPAMQSAKTASEIVRRAHLGATGRYRSAGAGIHAAMPAEEDEVLEAVGRPEGLPAEIDLRRHRDFEGRAGGQWLRRAFVALLVLFLAAALANVFGQAAATDMAGGASGTLAVKAPSRIRGGLTYQGEFVIHATRPLGAPTLVLDRGWVDQTTVNTVQPEPAGSITDAEGDLKLRFAPMAPGRTLVVYVEFQANPINVGSHDAGVSLYDGGRSVASISRTQFDFP